MARKRKPIPFFTDQNVPDSVGAVLLEAGHKVIRLRDVMDVATVDPVIATACATGGQVLVTHDTDFKVVSRRLQITQREYHQSLHRICLRCPEPSSATRITAALSLIESEWKLATPENPLTIEIHGNNIRVCR